MIPDFHSRFHAGQGDIGELLRATGVAMATTALVPARADREGWLEPDDVAGIGRLARLRGGRGDRQRGDPDGRS